MQVVEERESVKVLKECIALQESKGKDYQNAASDVKQADYYGSGVRTIREMIEQKLLRIKSVEQTFERNGGVPNHESMEDSYKDLINYASFAVSYIRGTMDGQLGHNDILNRRIIRQEAPNQQSMLKTYSTLAMPGDQRTS